MQEFLAVSVFLLTVLSIFVNRGVIRGPDFLDIPYQWSPLIGASLIYILVGLGPETVFQGLVGLNSSSSVSQILSSEGPFSTIVLFLSVAFISLSLEVSGFFRFLSVKILERTEGSGKELFFAVFWTSAVLALFTSNDILILTLTPFLLEFLDLTDLPAVPFLIAEFFAANIFSIVLVIGNETNIIVSSAHSIGFLEQPAHTLLPGLGGGIAAFLVLYRIFSSEINKSFSAEDLPEVSLNRWELLSSGLLLSTILSFGVLSIRGFILWHLGIIWASITFLVFILPDLWRRKRENRLRNSFLEKINRKMPWEVVPFLTGFFLMIQAFTALGLTSELTQLMRSFFGNGLFETVFGIGILSTISANLINNIPMTALFSEALKSYGSNGAGALYALIIGGNIGANLTPIGALAGIMWMKMVNHGKQRITFGEFLRYGWKTTSVTALVSFGILYLLLL
jgi:arsenical pump membrane protein